MQIANFLVAIMFTYAVLYFVSETAQRYLYDNVTPGLWWRSIIGAVILGALLVKFPLEPARIFEASIWPVLFQVVCWMLVFWLGCGYQWQHGCAMGAVSYFLCAWIATIALDSLRPWIGAAGAS